MISVVSFLVGIGLGFAGGYWWRKRQMRTKFIAPREYKESKAYPVNQTTSFIDSISFDEKYKQASNITETLDE